MTFIGQKHLRETLERLLDRDRLPAALLLTGAPGIGKSLLARMLAARLLGLQTPGGLSLHPDLLRLELQQTPQVRDALVALLHRVHDRPLAAPRRVVLLEDIDRLSPPTAALLLKTIEDAPQKTRFLLSTSARERVPLTLRSRVLTRDLLPVSLEELAAGLRARGVSDHDARELALLAGGRPGLALRLAVDDAARERYRRWARVVDALIRGQKPPEIPQDEFNDTSAVEEYLIFLQSRCRSGALSLRLLRRVREALTMLRHHVPGAVVIEYAVGSTRA